MYLAIYFNIANTPVSYTWTYLAFASAWEIMIFYFQQLYDSCKKKLHLLNYIPQSIKKIVRNKHTKCKCCMFCIKSVLVPQCSNAYKTIDRDFQPINFHAYFFANQITSLQQTFPELLFKYVVANALYFVVHFYATNFIWYLLKCAKSKFKIKFPIGSPHKKSVQCNVWENVRFYCTNVCVCFCQVSTSFCAL